MSQQSKIDELERLLNSEEDTPIQILPNGEIRQIGHATSAEHRQQEAADDERKPRRRILRSAMDIARIQREFAEAQRTFALVELQPDDSTARFTPARRCRPRTAGNYVLSIKFPDNYPNEMPRVFIDAPTITHAPHRYQAGHICYLHPYNVESRRVHHLTFVIGRAAKWLNKYEVWRNNGGTWPGAEIRH